MTFATAIPDVLVEEYLQRLETKNLKNERFDCCGAGYHDQIGNPG